MDFVGDSIHPCCQCCTVVPMRGMRSSFAATRSVCSFLNSSSLCCTASFSFIMVLVQPMSGVAEIWKAAPVFPCASQRSSGGILDPDLAALAYSGGGSWVSSACVCWVLGVVRAKFFSFLPSLLCLPFLLWHTFVMCPFMLLFPQVTSSRLILQTFCLCGPQHL